MMKMQDIQPWVDLVYASSVYKSICDNSHSNVSNTHVYAKCENTQKMLKNRVQKSVWQMK